MMIPLGQELAERRFLAALTAIPSIRANAAARARLAATSDLTGLVTGPVLMLHTTIDPLFPQESTTAYLDTLTARGRQDRLLRAFTQSRPGHCEFNPSHVTGAILAVRSWLETGVRPDADDDTLFPTTQGFTRSFFPGPWPF